MARLADFEATLFVPVNLVSRCCVTDKALVYEQWLGHAHNVAL